ncbi:MAG: DUF4270 family protein [Chitinophagales bacterium]|nr:DUF4270 family protein [Chitinophagales bacterium]
MRISSLSALFFLGSIVFFSCNKPVLDDDGTSPTDNLGLAFTDTLTVQAFTVLEDTLRSDGLAVNVIGSLDDPIFGTTHASVYTEFTLPVNNLDLGDTLVLDSIVLCMRYAGFYGDSTSAQTFIVKRMTEEMNVDSLYSSNRYFTAPDEVGRLSNFVANTTDSLLVDSAKTGPQLRIKLDNSLGQDLLNQSGSGNFADNAAFQAYFNGLYIMPDTTNAGNNVLYFDLRTAESGLFLYYNDTVIRFPISSLSETVNNYKHNYTGSTVAQYLDTTGGANDSLIFVQGLSGVKTRIFVPYIRNLGNIAINRAELEFTVVSSDSGTYKNPGRLIANGVGENGENTLLPDQLISTDYLGGAKTSSNGTVKYKLNLARYYQSLVEGGEDSGIHVFPTPPNRIGDRAVLGGGNHSQYRLKLNLTYTKIE